MTGDLRRGIAQSCLREYAYILRQSLVLNVCFSANWHADITFEPVPSDYAILKIHTLPTINGSVTGGDTLWAS